MNLKYSINTTLILITSLLLISCLNNNPQSGHTAKNIIHKSIIGTGLDNLKPGKSSFEFRNKYYTYSYTQGGKFLYTRSQTDSSGNTIKDELSNNGLIRSINDTIINLNAEDEQKYSNSINSVIYFAFLPLWLEDDAVIASYLGTEEINHIQYFKIKVEFQEEGGGEDFNDRFIYWFNPNDNSVDFLAYQYFTNEGGMRFREAYNPQLVNGVLFQDYYNYKPSSEIQLTDIAKAYQNNELELLSEIKLENPQVYLQ